MTDIITISIGLGLILIYTLITIWNWFKFKVWIEQMIHDRIEAEALALLRAISFVKLSLAANEAGKALGRFADTLNDMIDNQKK
mgnify:CR=1 FL=1